ncbi:hypothetical protein D1816_08545 [Aquimarina sp. AD10]|uniref:DUF5689 domain-containing protein n=1 Tax=Aquimarina sp. AD10 TaxID=1714849 RepID=UPI000E4E2E24|nr:DUF5689 domain-containing protein [Aquimarina sp. AD10]AXT60395.1 hypothetical protein D1816_08545 [Aquimarina sp. AD10]RKN01170.1 hypothetical protein D7033_04940 [Aquimarina sp. AD10]
MNKYFLKLLPLLGILIITVFSCKNDEDITIPDTGIVTPPDLEPNVDLTFVKNLDDGTIIDFNTVQNNGELITSGFIISSDVADNINNQIYIQDKADNAESGVVIDVALNDIYLTHAIGRNIILKLNGLGMQKIDNALHIGVLENGTLSPMDSDDFKEFVFRTSTLETIVPKKLTINEILQASESTDEDDDISTILVSIDEVQIVNDELSSSYANPDNNETVLRTLIGCTDNKNIVLQNSGLSNFKALPFPTEKGTITGILTKDVLTIRDTDDVNFTESRCGTGLETTTNITIADVVAEADGTNLVKFDDVTFATVQSGDDPVFTGYAISSDAEKNIVNELYLQASPENPDAGIIIDFAAVNLFETYPIGQKVSVNLSGLGMQMVNGNLHIGKLNTAEDAIEPITPSQTTFNEVVAPSDDPAFTIVPTTVTIEQIEAGTFIPLTLVQLVDMQIAADNQGQTFDGDKELLNCTTKTKVTLRNNATANFASETLPNQQGVVTAIIAQDPSIPYLVIRETTDLNFTAALCQEKEILIDEDFQGIDTGDIGFDIALDGWVNANSNSNIFIRWTSNNNSDNIFAEILNGGPTDQYNAWLITPELTIVTERTLTLSFDINVNDRNSDNLEVLIVGLNGNVITEQTIINDIVPQNNTSGFTPIETTITIPDGQDTFRIGFRYRKSSGTPSTTEYQIDNLKIVEQ